jgi:Flp pilus assembly protein CpaB
MMTELAAGRICEGKAMATLLDPAAGGGGTITPGSRTSVGRCSKAPPNWYNAGRRTGMRTPAPGD